MMFINMHKHTTHSLFDGFGTPMQGAVYAKEMEQPALAITDHGSITGIIQHYVACQENDIKPILGIEAYFQGTIHKDKDHKRFHMTIWVKNKKGFENLMQIVSESNQEENFYYKPIVTMAMLKKYSEGLIIGSACLAGYMSQQIMKQVVDGIPGGYLQAKAFARRMKQIFKDDFYIEIMPYKVFDTVVYQDGSGEDKEMDLQLYVNEKLIQIANNLKIKMLITTDSHFVKAEDFDTYAFMHSMRGKDKEHIEKIYKKRYMPTEKEIRARIAHYHPSLRNRVDSIMDVFQEIYDKVENFSLGMTITEAIPAIFGDNALDILYKKAVKGFKEKGKWNERRKKKVEEEIDIIGSLGFEHYFLLIEDIIDEAIRRKISIGPGRGSVCGSNIAFGANITEVDPMYFGTLFERFLRYGKEKMPDIDLDFESARRNELISYVLENYESAQISDFGYYRFDNLVNDIAKAMEMDIDDKKLFKRRLKKIKKNIEDDEIINFDLLMQDKELKDLNIYYPDCVKHFSKLHGQIKYIGTHSAGLVITPGKLEKHIGLMRKTITDKKTGEKNTVLACPWDKYDIEGTLNLLKVDLLGLTTLDEIKEVEEKNDFKIDYYKILEDEDLMDEILENFAQGNTLGIFQFERDTPMEIFKALQPDCIDDIIAVNALNRPAPLSLGMDKKYVAVKHNELEEDEFRKYIIKHTKDTNGVIIYQEHVMKICRGLAHMSWVDIDEILSVLKSKKNKMSDELRAKFVNGVMEYASMSEELANELLDAMTQYLFNKGHATGYVLVALAAMYCKIKYPIDFFSGILKFEAEKKQYAYLADAVKNSCVVLLPHVNGPAETSVVELDGEDVIWLGLSTLKNVGLKAAIIIENVRKEKGRKFRSIEQIKEIQTKNTRIINVRTMRIMEESGAMEFDMTIWYKRIKKYNAALYSRNTKIH